MKLLLDTCVWGGARTTLADAGHDCDWVGDWPEDPGDAEILDHAITTKRVLITLDKDFGELAVVHGQRHFGIVRLVGFRAREQATACLRVLERYGADLEASALITVTRHRVRVRPAESGR